MRILDSIPQATEKIKAELPVQYFQEKIFSVLKKHPKIYTVAAVSTILLGISTTTDWLMTSSKKSQSPSLIELPESLRNSSVYRLADPDYNPSKIETQPLSPFEEAISGKKPALIFTPEGNFKSKRTEIVWNTLEVAKGNMGWNRGNILSPPYLARLKRELATLLQNPELINLDDKTFDSKATELRKRVTKEMYASMTGKEFWAHWKKYNLNPERIGLAMWSKSDIEREERGSLAFSENPNFLNQYGHLISNAASEHNEAEHAFQDTESLREIVEKIIWTESKGDTNAVSNKYYFGLGQLGTYFYDGKDKRYSQINPFNPEEAILRVTKIVVNLSQEMRRRLKKELPQRQFAEEIMKKIVLTAYFWGPTGTLEKIKENEGEIPKLLLTYSDKVLAAKPDSTNKLAERSLEQDGTTVSPSLSASATSVPEDGTPN